MITFTKEEIEVRKSISDSEVHYALAELTRRAWKVNPVVKSKIELHGGYLPNYARGAFMTYPKKPILNHILLLEDMDPHEEIIVLAHELGHAENFLHERERWEQLQIPLLAISKGFKPFDIVSVLVEEISANARGRKHLNEIAPDVVPEYDRQMSMALTTAAIRLESMPDFLGTTVYRSYKAKR